MNKFRAWYRRKRLGKKLKHQYQCHPAFDLQRAQTSVELFWKNQKIAELADISHYKQSRSGSTFIIATGPSLNEIDFERLRGVDTLSLNCAIDKFDEHGFAPTQCLIVDHRIFEFHWPSVRNSILSGAQCFFSAVGLSRIAEREPSLLANKNITLIDSFDRKFGIPRMNDTEFKNAINSPAVWTSPYTDKFRSVGFCSDARLGVFSGKTVATWAIQLQYYLGYHQQFIAGMDLGGTGKSHFYVNNAKTNKAPDFLADYEPHIRVCFELARKAAGSLGFEVYNLSEQSTLPSEIISKISYDKALEIAQRTDFSQ